MVPFGHMIDLYFSTDFAAEAVERRPQHAGGGYGNVVSRAD